MKALSLAVAVSCVVVAAVVGAVVARVAGVGSSALLLGRSRKGHSWCCVEVVEAGWNTVAICINSVLQAQKDFAFDAIPGAALTFPIFKCCGCKIQKTKLIH